MSFLKAFKLILLAFGVILFTQTVLAGPSIDAMLVMPLSERQEMADEFYSEKKYRRARKQYGILARLGSKHAMHMLATMNLEGQGMKKDPVQGWVWAALAAEFEQTEYAELRDSAWDTLDLDQREECVGLLQEQMLRYTDAAIAHQVRTEARRKLRMQSIGHGIMSEGLVKTWRAEGMAGDPQRPDGLLNMLKSIHYQAKLYDEGTRVELGEFKVLEDGEEAQVTGDDQADETSPDSND